MFPREYGGLNCRGRTRKPLFSHENAVNYGSQRVFSIRPGLKWSVSKDPI
jgi:hypothetical protein